MSVQFGTLMMMLLSGIGMGIAFDSYRVVSNRLHIGRLLIPILDLLYWLAATIIVFRVLMANNDGEVRIYIFIGLLIGIGFYFWLFSSTVIAFVVWLIETIRKLIRFLVRCFELLVIKPMLILYKLVRVLLGFALAISLFILKLTGQLLRPFWLLLAWMIRPAVRPLWRAIEPYWKKIDIAGRFIRIRTSCIALWKRWFGED
nr:spore cortex biosynthesis protein YabQ [Paenibacillus roseus]